MRFLRSDRRALLFLFVGIVAVWGGVLLDRHILRPSSSLLTLDEAAMDSFEVQQHNLQPTPGPSLGKGVPIGSSSAETNNPSQGRDEDKLSLFPFDPNTADSATLLRLGLARWQVKNIYKYRARGGRYHRPEDFKRLYGMTPELWQRLAPFIRIGKQFRYYTEADFVADDARRAAHYDSLRARREAAAARRDSLAARYPHQEKFAELTIVDLNTADTTLLKHIPGIASVRARQIVRYRERLGGFVSPYQLAEIDGFPADELIEWFSADPAAHRLDGTPVIHRLNVNTATVQQLGRHPYIGYTRARAIDDYRRNHGIIHNLADLRLLPDFSEDVLHRLEPYVEY